MRWHYQNIQRVFEMEKYRTFSTHFDELLERGIIKGSNTGTSKYYLDKVEQGE
jgi:hypothetical protein